MIIFNICLLTWIMRVKTDGEINIKFGKKRIVFTLLIDLKHKYHPLFIAKQSMRTIACFFFKRKNACSRHMDQLTGSTVCLIVRFKRNGRQKQKLKFANGMYPLALICVISCHQQICFPCLLFINIKTIYRVISFKCHPPPSPTVQC